MKATASHTLRIFGRTLAVTSIILPVSELERGHALHQTKCAKCHGFENPADYEIDELTDDIMPEMARKAKLDMVGEKAVLAYLLAARKMPVQENPAAR